MLRSTAAFLQCYRRSYRSKDTHYYNSGFVGEFNRHVFGLNSWRKRDRDTGKLLNLTKKDPGQNERTVLTLKISIYKDWMSRLHCGSVESNVCTSGHLATVTSLASVIHNHVCLSCLFF